MERRLWLKNVFFLLLHFALSFLPFVYVYGFRGRRKLYTYLGTNTMKMYFSPTMFVLHTRTRDKSPTLRVSISSASIPRNSKGEYDNVVKKL